MRWHVRAKALLECFAKSEGASRMLCKILWTAPWFLKLQRINQTQAHRLSCTVPPLRGCAGVPNPLLRLDTFHSTWDLPCHSRKISKLKIEKISESKENRRWLNILPASDPLIHWRLLLFGCHCASSLASSIEHSRRPALSKLIQQIIGRCIYAAYFTVVSYQTNITQSMIAIQSILSIETSINWKI